MRTAATHYPQFSPDAGKVINLEQRINLCRTERQKAKAFAYESEDLLGLTVYLAHQAKGLPMTISITGPNAESFCAWKDLLLSAPRATGSCLRQLPRGQCR